MRTRSLRRWCVGGGVILALVAVGSAVWLNREWIYDYFRGVSYEPVGEMVRIRDDLKLTERGRFLFNAAQPVLNDSTAFNNYCRTESGGDAEVAVLGCYRNGNIYIYNITSEELDGIRELTAAHELLHAVWARMSEEERVALVEPLTRTFEANQEMLGKELDNYDTSEKQEELFVRAGTEVKNLPAKLEQVYGEIFTNQDLVVDFYESYITVFREIEAEMADLKSEMDAMMVKIEWIEGEYERRWGQLNADVVSFNACAAVEGCMKSVSEFNTRRAAILAEQTALEELYNEINGLISEYNDLVEKYNADVTQSEKLNQMINSSQKPEETNL